MNISTQQNTAIQLQAHQLELLTQFSHSIMSQRDPEALYYALLEAAQGSVGFKSAIVYRYNEHAQELSPVAEHSSKSSSKQRPEDKEDEANAAVLAEMTVPLTTYRAVYGTFLLQRAEAFNDEEQHQIHILSNLAAVTLENIELARQVDDATRAKASFLSMITHELRAPLNTINGYLDLALSGAGGEMDEQMRNFLRRSRAGSEQLYAMIEDLLLVARADAGQWSLKRTLVNLADSITNAVEELELTAADQDITVTVEHNATLPLLYADAGRIQQVLRNLLSNALRFTPPGGHVTISTAITALSELSPTLSTEQERAVVLRVHDTGGGIAPEYQQRVFERFFQIPTTNEGHKGLGLGLTAVKMVVEGHGGTVMVESAPGQGSTFSCTLPCLLSQK